MLVDEVVDDFDGLRACLALDDAVLDSDGEVVRAAAHVNVRRIVIEGVDVNQDALDDQYLTHALECFVALWVQRYETFQNYCAISPTFLIILRHIDV